MEWIPINNDLHRSGDYELRRTPLGNWVAYHESIPLMKVPGPMEEAQMVADAHNRKPNRIRTSTTELDPRGGLWCALICIGTLRDYIPERHTSWMLSTTRLVGLVCRGQTVNNNRLQRLNDAGLRNVEDLEHEGIPLNSKYFTHPVAVTQGFRYLLAASIAAQRGEKEENVRRVSNHIRHALAESAAATGDVKQKLFKAICKEQASPIAPATVEHPLWDWLQEFHPAPTRVGRLSDALARAWRFRLSWWKPLHRAIAERCTDLDELPSWWRNR